MSEHDEGSQEAAPPEAPSEPAPAPEPEIFAARAEEAATPSRDPGDASVEAQPLEPAEPGIYWCETENPGVHPVIGGLVEGENDFRGMTHPDELLALAALVQAGVLEKMDKAVPEAEPAR